LSDQVDVSELPRRRATSADATAARSARLFVSRYRTQLEAWHRGLATLRARTLRNDLTLVRVEASRLLAQIIEERQQLADDVRAAPEMIRSNSLVRDINRAMSRLESEVRHLSGR